MSVPMLLADELDQFEEDVAQVIREQQRKAMAKVVTQLEYVWPGGVPELDLDALLDAEEGR